MRKRLWSPDEDEKLQRYVEQHGFGNWSEVAKRTGLQRCGKSCRLRWINYLRPDLKRGKFTPEEKQMIVSLQKVFGNSWSKIAAHLPGRTDSDIKNFWHSHFRKKRPHILPLQGVPNPNSTLQGPHNVDAYVDTPLNVGHLPSDHTSCQAVHPSFVIHPLMFPPQAPPPLPAQPSSLNLPICTFHPTPAFGPAISIADHNDQLLLPSVVSHGMPCLEDDALINHDEQAQQHHHQVADVYQVFHMQPCDTVHDLECNATSLQRGKHIIQDELVHDHTDNNTNSNGKQHSNSNNNASRDCSASSTSHLKKDGGVQHVLHHHAGVEPPEGLELVVWSCMKRTIQQDQQALRDDGFLNDMAYCSMDKEQYTAPYFHELQ